MNPNEVTGCRISNGRTRNNYRNKDNGPLAIIKTWKVLDNFKMEGDMWLAVYDEKYIQKCKWLIEVIIIMTPLFNMGNHLILNVIFGFIVLVIEMKLCYNESGISKAKSEVEFRCYCPNRCMTRSPKGEGIMNPNEVTGCRISNGRTRNNYRNKDNGYSFFDHYEIA